VAKERQVRLRHLAPLPYYADVKGAPQNTAIGGASLWVMAGKKPEEYKGVADVLELPERHQGASRQPPAHGLPAHHHGRL
jgi:ABC-type glycerol-3-phosphate transport system substrate-binding protein